MDVPSASGASTDLFREAFDASPVPIVLLSCENERCRCLLVNEAFCGFTGFSADEIYAGGLELVTEPGDLLELTEQFAKGETVIRLEQRYRRADGTLVPGLMQLTRAGDAERPYWIGQVLDLTERKRIERELAHQAMHDPLTGLPNRVLFMDRVDQAMRADRRKGSHSAVLFVDLDNFKLVNDSLGHAAGDRLLVEVSRRLTDAVREVDTVARLGGDEFAVLATDIGGPAGATVVASRLLDAIKVPLAVGGDELFASISVGIAVTAVDVEAPEDLIGNADLAMYRAKASGRARAELFDEDMRRNAIERLAVERDLRGAVKRDELRLHFQPLISLADETVVGCEALIRWEHPERGLIQPAGFLAVAEESGLSIPIGEWVLEQACMQARRWRSQGKDISVSVNLSPRQLSSPNLASQVTSTLNATGLPAQALCVEVTEDAVMERMDVASATLRSLRQAGVRIALDDFGKGHSSLGYLKELPVDVIKLDRGFIGSLHRNREDRAIVSAVVSLASVLGLTVIAEGVERRSHVEELQALGCEFAQGFYFARPQPADQLPLEGFMARGRPGVGDPLVIREFMRQIGIPAGRRVRS